MDSSSLLLLLSVVLASSAVLQYLFRDPLSHVPGPRIARWTSLWVQFLDFSGYRSLVIHDLHAKYGPVVRIAPNELSFSSKRALREIYSPNSDYSKAPRYAAFGRKSMFTMLDKQEHRLRAKRISPVFGPSMLATVEGTVSAQIEKLVHILDNLTGQSVDVMLWFRMMTLDTFGDMFLGTNFGGLDNKRPPEILEDLDNVFPTYWIEWQFPWLFRVLCMVPHRSLHQFITTGHRFYRKGAQAFNQYIQLYGRHGERRDLLQRMIAASTEKKIAAPLTDEEIVVELTNLIFAGTDTTGNTFSYMFWELARNPIWQARLRKELLEVSWSGVVPEYKTVAQLPILEAIIQETLRLWPAAPASLPRIASAQGGVIDGTTIPPYVSLPFFLEAFAGKGSNIDRDPEVFPFPDEFRPERWLAEDEAGNGLQSDLDAMRDSMLVWGKGSRTCLGKSIAMMELKLGLAAIIKLLSPQLASEKTNEDMEIRDHFVLIAKGGRCLLRFEKVSSLFAG
ncbi:hypothetical protein AYL99_06963 [Fonsecaea erecta]|uniref:Cytochrome P450 n=1 Tax=Fonsecaea erecta TaxID=1367422 RepID=A0A178ZKV9_9EURO|nr:hypothetical protein AYL99_06963 [Fonsecaea erecta]OAP59665.1 hypothetical protein AYL99_06963 [Fonsecaea erecta]